MSKYFNYPDVLGEIHWPQHASSDMANQERKGRTKFSRLESTWNGVSEHTCCCWSPSSHAPLLWLLVHSVRRGLTAAQPFPSWRQIDEHTCKLIGGKLCVVIRTQKRTAICRALCFFISCDEKLLPGKFVHPPALFLSMNETILTYIFTSFLRHKWPQPKCKTRTAQNWPTLLVFYFICRT